MPEANSVRKMFSGIAGRYDIANHLLSMGFDFYWRKRLVRKVQAVSPALVYDLATGSGDVAFALREALPGTTELTGMDFCQPMLDQAIEKREQRGVSNLEFKQADCLDLPMEDSSADVLTISFGLRNFEDRHKGLSEFYRVLKPGGSFFCLEFTQPSWWMLPFYRVYLKFILPRLAAWITKDKDAYVYLGDTISAFPAKPELAEQIKAAGFETVSWTGLTGSIVSIHHAVKQC